MYRQVNNSLVSSGRSPNLRVLQIVESSAGGTGRHVLDLAEGLLARGCDVQVVYSSHRVDQIFLDRVARLDPAKVLVLPMRTVIHPADFGIVRAVRRYLRRAGPFDIIHGHSSKGGAIARLAAVGTRAKVFYTIHGLIMADPGLARLKRFVYWSIELLLSRWTSRIIAVSPEEQRNSIGLGFGAWRVALIPNGINTEFTNSRAQARQLIGLGDDHFVVGFVGRLVDQKAPDVLLRAFAMATEGIENARLAMIGDGPLLASLKELATQLSVSHRILWLGERDAQQLYPAFDVFAIASQKEGLPYVVLEAMAAGLPIVATESAGVELLVRSGENGSVVPIRDVDAFATAIKQMMQDPSLRIHYGNASRQRSRLFTVDRMVNQTLAAYREALEPQSAAVGFEDDEPVLSAEGETS